MSLKAGKAVVDISNGKPMFLVGYPHVERMSSGVNDPLFASALYLENGSEALLTIALDLLFIDAATVADMRGKIAAGSGMKAENIMISCTHTHSGPLTMDMLSFRNDSVVPAVDPQYMSSLIELTAEAGIMAVRSAKPAELAVTSTEVSGVGCNRHDPAGPRDPEAGILVIRDALNKTIEAVSLTYCMHPTVLHEDSKLLSSDFPGYTREYLKAQFGKDIAVIYHTGPEGNQSPRYDVKGQTFAEAERLGNILGEFIAEEISSLTDEDFSADPVIRVSHKMISPIRRELPSLEEAEKNLAFRKSEFERLKAENAGHGPVRTAECSVFGAEETHFLAKCVQDGRLDAKLAEYTEMEVQVMRIGTAFLVNFPGEMFVEYSLDLKREFHKKYGNDRKIFAVCLANGECQGYIVTEDAEGYEADNSLFMPETGKLMLDSALNLISNLI